MAAPVINGKTQFFDAAGVSLALGSVAFYIPGTLTPKDTWQDSAGTILNTNPVALDASGSAIIYGNGSYRQIVKDSLGNTIWDQVAQSVPTVVSLSGTGGAAQVGMSAGGTVESVLASLIGYNGSILATPNLYTPQAPTANQSGFGVVNRLLVQRANAEGAAGTPITYDALLRPEFYIERHSGGSLSDYQSGESNVLLAPSFFISTTAESTSTNALSGIHSRMISDTTAPAAPAATGVAHAAGAPGQAIINTSVNDLCAYTGYARAGAPTSTANRSIWAANFIVAHASGNVPANCVGVEIDVIPEVTPASGSDVGITDNFTGIWIQAAGTNGTTLAPMWATCGLFISSATNTTGFVQGIRLTASCKTWAMNLTNNATTAGAHGVSIQTACTDPNHNILVAQALGTAGTQLAVSGTLANPISIKVNSTLRNVQTKAFSTLAAGDLVLIGV